MSLVKTIKNLSPSQKTYIYHYFRTLLILAAVLFLFSFPLSEKPGEMNLLNGLMIMGLFTPFFIAHIIATNYMKRGEPL